jgi:hypothetical protein
MKATKLIEILEERIKKYGDNIEVFVECPGMNYEDTFTTSDRVGNYVPVDNLSDYDENLIFEEHGDNNGLVFGVLLIGKNLIDHYG